MEEIEKLNFFWCEEARTTNKGQFAAAIVAIY
jgi:hypothetical protein